MSVGSFSHGTVIAMFPFIVLNISITVPYEKLHSGQQENC